MGSIEKVLNIITLFDTSMMYLRFSMQDFHLCLLSHKNNYEKRG